MSEIFFRILKRLRNDKLVLSDKLIFHVAPKNACSLIKRYFYRVQTSRKFSRIYLFDKNIFSSHFVYPAEVFKAQKKFLYRFCMVRDPIKRFESFFRNKIISEKKYLNEIKEIHLKDHKRNCDINYFIDNLEEFRSNSNIIKHHTDPQVIYLGKDRSYYSTIFSFNDFDLLAKKLENITGVPLETKKINSSGDQKCNINKSALVKLKDFYREDYEVFGGYFES